MNHKPAIIISIDSNGQLHANSQMPVIETIMALAEIIKSYASNVKRDSDKSKTSIVSPFTGRQMVLPKDDNGENKH